MTKPVVMLADPNELFREGVALVLGQEAYEITQQTSVVTAAAELTAKALPDLLICDPAQGMFGVFTEIKKLIRKFPGLKVLILTQDITPGVMRAASDAGTVGVIAKHNTVQALRMSVELVLVGGTVFPAYASPITALDIASGATQDVINRLTPREMQTLELITQGKSNAEIAAAMKIVPGTVKVNVRNMYSKLEIKDRADAVALGSKLFERAA